MDKKIFSKQIWLNLFAEFILDEMGTNFDSQIEVADCENFLVVKGKTSSMEILNLNEIKRKFTEEFPDVIKPTHTIDLLEYGCEPKRLNELTSIFFNTSNLVWCLENQNNLIAKSEFPYGYSFQMGKGLHLYSKHIVYNLQSKINFDKVKIKICSSGNEDNFQIFIDSCSDVDEKVRSSILDAFHFEFQKFEKKSESMDWKKKIIDIEYEFDFIKEINQNLIII